MWRLHLGLGSRLKAPLFLCGKWDYNPSMLFGMFIVLWLKFIVLLMVNNVHYVAKAYHIVVGCRCSLCHWLSFSLSMNNHSMNIVVHHVVNVHYVAKAYHVVVGCRCSLCHWLSFSLSMNNQSMNIVVHRVANVHCVCLLS
jgi:hypothetical protein